MIDFTDECDCQLYKTSTSGINYDVFFLESMVRSKFIGGFSGKNYTTTEKAYFLVKYLERHIPLGYDKVFIVLGECPNEIKEREMIFRAFIENMETSGYEVYVHHMEGKSIRPCKKLGLHIEMERYSNKFKDSDVGYATVMDSPLKQA